MRLPLALALVAILALTGCTTTIRIIETPAKPCEVSFGEPRTTLEHFAPHVYPYKMGYCTATIPPTCFWQDLPTVLPPVAPDNSITFLNTPSTGATLQNDEAVTLWYEGVRIVTP